MAKPIFIIAFPINADSSQVLSVQSELSIKLGDDYHVLTYKSPDTQTIEFEVLNAVNAEDIEISDLIQRTSTFIQTMLNSANDLAEELTKNNQE